MNRVQNRAGSAARAAVALGQNSILLLARSFAVTQSVAKDKNSKTEMVFLGISPSLAFKVGGHEQEIGWPERPLPLWEREEI